MLGYDWPRLHAALNDLPTAFIVFGALLALIDQFMRRDSLRAASYWMIVLGWAGTILAVIAGLQAEEVVDHGDAVHLAFVRHETMGLITLAVVSVVALWRIARERKMGAGEQSIVLGVTLTAAGLVVATSQIGGDLVFDHALGIPTTVLEETVQDRTAGHAHAGGEAHSHGEGTEPQAEGADSAADSAGVATDSTTGAAGAGAADHEHAPGTPPHEH